MKFNQNRDCWLDRWLDRWLWIRLVSKSSFEFEIQIWIVNDDCLSLIFNLLPLFSAPTKKLINVNYVQMEKKTFLSQSLSQKTTWISDWIIDLYRQFLLKEITRCPKTRLWGGEKNCFTNEIKIILIMLIIVQINYNQKTVSRTASSWYSKVGVIAGVRVRALNLECPSCHFWEGQILKLTKYYLYFRAISSNLT